jgi:hypothetical protein
MPRGGARVRSGPAPDPNALRRVRDEGEWVTLPAKTGVTKAPSWPLVEHKNGDIRDRELALWQSLWLEKPQALMWERLGLEYEVALYVRRLGEAELPRSAVILGTLVRQMADALGLTPTGLRANRWRIASDETEPRRSGAGRSSGPSSRDRLKVVSGG